MFRALNALQNQNISRILSVDIKLQLYNCVVCTVFVSLRVSSILTMSIETAVATILKILSEKKIVKGICKPKTRCAVD